MQVGTGPRHEAPGGRRLGSLQTPVPSAKAHSIPEGLLYTVCVLGQGGPGGFLPWRVWLLRAYGAPLLGTAVVFSLLMLGLEARSAPLLLRPTWSPEQACPPFPRVQVSRPVFGGSQRCSQSSLGSCGGQ